MMKGYDCVRYRKKPVVVEAVRWTGENHAEICDFIDFEVFEIKPKEGLIIKTLEGVHHASVGDYIIKGVNGEFYPCKPDIFEKTYEKVQSEDEFESAMFARLRPVILDDGASYSICNALEKSELQEKLNLAVSQLHGICSACKNYSSYHRKGKCRNCKFDNANPACLRWYQDDCWEWNGS